MEQQESIKKNYTKKDIDMIEQSGVMLRHFITYKTNFIAKFIYLEDPFAANWQAAIDVVDTIPTNFRVMAEIGVLTQEVQREVRTARKHYQTLVLYLRMIYAESVGVVEAFGQSNYKAARYNPLKMLELLELAGSLANEAPYKQALISKGFKQADINKIKTIEQALRAKNKAQEAAKNSRVMATQTRYAALNAVWDFMVTVNAAAQLVFMNDYAKRHQFRLYPHLKQKPKVKQ